MRILLGGIAVALAVLTAAPAHADAASQWGLANEERICTVWAEYPNASGLLGIGQEIVAETGFTYTQAGEAVGVAVQDFCPAQWPALQRVLNRINLNGATT
jgi:hypothetical protein